MMDAERPAYYKLYADAWDEINRNLPRAQAAKLVYAMMAYFFDGEEPGDGELPKPARALFNIQRSQIGSYRQNALNGRKACKKPAKELTETCEVSDQVSTQKPTQEIEGSQPTLAAETPKVGYKAPAKGPAKGPSNIINHKSLITNNSLVLVSREEAARAEAGAAQGRPAPALPTRAEYDRVARLLETQGLDALTEHDREVYHAGHKAYATSQM